MGVILPIDVLMDCAYTLVEPVINTTLGANIGPGAQTVNVSASVAKALYVGALLVVGVRGGNLEVSTVSAVGATSFTATFANAHITTDPLQGATFPTAQDSSAPLFSQAEVLGLLSDVQNDFLLRVQPIIATDTVNLLAATRIYDQPSDCIRIERISIAGQELLDSSQSDLDADNPNWAAQTGAVTKWFQDQLNNAKFGVKKVPTAPATALLYYSQRAAQSLGFIDSFLVQDVFTYILKYGVLARCWSKDGEAADPRRGAYAQKRFDFGVFLALRFIANVQLMPEHRQPQSQFKPMMVPQLPDQAASPTPAEGSIYPTSGGQ